MSSKIFLVLLLALAGANLCSGQEPAAHGTATQIVSAPYRTGEFATWDAKALRWTSEGHAAFIHFTGEGCSACQAQWSTFNLERLYSISKDKDVFLFEANLKPGADNNFILSSMKDYKLGGVPSYVYITKDQKVHILSPGIWSANNILSEM